MATTNSTMKTSTPTSAVRATKRSVKKSTPSRVAAARTLRAATSTAAPKATRKSATKTAVAVKPAVIKSTAVKAPVAERTSDATRSTTAQTSTAPVGKVLSATTKRAAKSPTSKSPSSKAVAAQAAAELAAVETAAAAEAVAEAARGRLADQRSRREANARDTEFSRGRRVGGGGRPPRGGEPAPNYNDHNVEMFTERRDTQRRLTEIEDTFDETGRAPTFALRREAERKKRRLDDITTEIIRFNYGLVRSYVKKFTSNTSREDSADFEAAAIVGLMRAIDSFDIDKGRFGSWAYKPIVREVLRAVRDADHPNMNPGDFERRPDILRALAGLQEGDDDYNPSFAEIAAEAGVTIEQVGRVLDAPHLDSLSTPVGDDGDASLGDLIEDRHHDVEGAVMSALTISALDDYGLKVLDSRELLVLARRFGLDCEPEQKLAGIGAMLGLSREAVRQVEAKALAKIQHPVVLRKIQRQGRL